MPFPAEFRKGFIFSTILKNEKKSPFLFAYFAPIHRTEKLTYSF